MNRIISRISSRTLSTNPNEAAQIHSDYVKSDVYQFLQKSPVPADKFQRSLPRLPIPKVRYIRSLSAINKGIFLKTVVAAGLILLSRH